MALVALGLFDYLQSTFTGHNMSELPFILSPVEIQNLSDYVKNGIGITTDALSVGVGDYIINMDVNNRLKALEKKQKKE